MDSDLLRDWRLRWLMGGLFLAGAWRALAAPVHHDLAWYFHVATRVLHGAEPYVDVLEVNPPLVLFLTVPVQALADMLGAAPSMLFRLFTLAGAGLSLVLSCRLLGRLRPAAAPLACLVATFVLVVWPGVELGQREHLVAMFALPYLLAAALRVRWPASEPAGTGEAALYGVLAGLLALKPFYILLLLVVESWVALRAGFRAVLRPETVAVLATLALYGAVLLLVTPGYLPLAVDALSVYPGYWPASPWLIATRSWQLVVVAVALLALLAPGRGPLHEVLALAVAFFTATVFAQNKGWFYHWIPAVTMATLLLAVVVGQAVRRRRWALSAGFGLLAAAVLLAAGAEDWRRMARHPYHLPELLSLAERHAEGGVIATLSTKVQTGFPLAYYVDAAWGLRLNALWHLPGLYEPSERRRSPFPYRAPPGTSAGRTQGPLEHRFFRAVVDDLTARPPAMLVVDRYGPGPGHRGFDFMAYFGQAPRFRALMRGYRVAAMVGDYAVLVPEER